MTWEYDDPHVPATPRPVLLSAASHVIRHAHDDEDRDALLAMLFRPPRSRACASCHRPLGVGRSCGVCYKRERRRRGRT